MTRASTNNSLESTLTECGNCSGSDLHCTYCGDGILKCTCVDIEVYCMSCGEISNLVIMDEAEAKHQGVPFCDCDDADQAKLVCDTCDVYRESLTDPWHWQTEGPSCNCRPEKDTECKTCGVVRLFPGMEWEWEEEGLYYSYKCRHYNHNVTFPSGVTVYASSMRNREAKDEAPDYGLYLDGGWDPSCPNTHLAWRDYGLPHRWQLAVATICDAYKRAEDGYWVEIGCIGGHGRTGTVLACMAVLSGMDGYSAVDWVRSTYCSSAIESDDQEWFVHWFDIYINGGSTDPMPVIKSWMNKKEKKAAKKKKPVTFQYNAHDRFGMAKLAQAVTPGRKPSYEYGPVLNRNVRKVWKSDKKEKLSDLVATTETTETTTA